MEFNIKYLGFTNYIKTYELMKDFTINRDSKSVDEIWITEHYPIYTLGLTGNKKHLLSNPYSIPIFTSDRGGQITYHAPGQVVIYTLIDLFRAKISVKNWIRKLEEAVITYINNKNQNHKAHRLTGKPGVYVNNQKIAALGLKIKKGRCYHGISINVNLDLNPFSNINPCGYLDMQVTQLADLGILQTPNQVSQTIINYLSKY